ncbi:hypothetical protein GGI13_002802 [Coemansia sp. RSA 455]|nr:hypothetical protein GGI13_002802 [Coemansia sp. RSA 455]
MTFVDDIDLLLHILPADNSCLDDSGSGAGLVEVNLGSIFGANPVPPNQPQSHGTQLDSASPGGNDSGVQGGESNHAIQPIAEKLPSHAIRNLDPISIQYTEKEKRERKYECQYCQKRFSRPSSLTSHVYTHTGERPFACDFLGCTKRFSVLSNLRRHYKVHSSRRTYSGIRPHNTSFHSSIYASAAPSRSYSFGAGMASLAEPASSRPTPASFTLNQEHPAMPSDYGMFSPASRELYSSSIASQSRSGSANRPTEFSNFNTSGYAPSFRTTASALSLPESFEASLLAGFPNEQILAAPGYQGPPSASSNSCSSNSSSPTSKQALCLASLGPSNGDGHAPTPIDNGFAPISQFDPAIATSQFEAIFGCLPTEHKIDNSDTSGASGSGSDSDNSSDHASATTDTRLLPLGGRGYGTASPADSLDALDVLIKASSSTAAIGSNSNTMHAALSEFFPRSPRIATRAILTNTSVTTKAMNGAIDPVGSAGQDLAMLLSLTPAKHAPLALVDLPPAHNHQPLLGSIGGMVTSHSFAESGKGDSGINDSMWQVLHTGHSGLR